METFLQGEERDREPYGRLRTKQGSLVVAPRQQLEKMAAQFPAVEGNAQAHPVSGELN